MSARYPQLTASPDHAVLEQAAYWYVQLKGGEHSTQEKRAWEAWLEADPSHQTAWMRLQTLERQWRDVPPDMALPTLEEARRHRRRATAKVLGLLMTTGAVGWVTRESVPWRVWGSDYRVGVGQHRELALADGSRIDINTDTALDVEYTEDARLIRLHRGEIAVRTAADVRGAGQPARSFLVETPHGRIRALGTFFSVRIRARETEVAVYEHAVELRPNEARGLAHRLETGQRAAFSDHAVGMTGVANVNQIAWRRGMLVAIDQPLGAFVDELTRYRSGMLVCDPAVATLRLSGAFRLADTTAVLDNLAASLPIRVRYVTRYWATLEPI